MQVSATIAETLVNFKPWSWLSGKKQAYLLGVAAMLSLPNITKVKDTIKAHVSDALHFRRGIRKQKRNCMLCVCV